MDGMNQTMRDLKGSPSRDKFKQLHKKMLAQSFWALDCDLELVEKYPEPCVMARLDFKMPNDDVGFTEGIAYNWYVNLPPPFRVPVFIIEAHHFDEEDTNKHRFTVKRYIQADWRPKDVLAELETVAENLTWHGLGEWEGNLRQAAKNERTQKKYSPALIAKALKRSLTPEQLDTVVAELVRLDE
jgi:hypothetical protein